MRHCNILLKLFLHRILERCNTTQYSQYDAIPPERRRTAAVPPLVRTCFDPTYTRCLHLTLQCTAYLSLSICIYIFRYMGSYICMPMSYWCIVTYILFTGPYMCLGWYADVLSVNSELSSLHVLYV